MNETKVNYSRVVPDGFTVTPMKNGERRVTMTGDVSLAAKLSLAGHFQHVLSHDRTSFIIASPAAVDLFRQAIGELVAKLIDQAAEQQKRAEFQNDVRVDFGSTGNGASGTWTHITTDASVPSTPTAPAPKKPKKNAKKAKRGADS